MVMLLVSAGVAGQTGRQRVLFVGNSLTMANGLTAMVEELARTAGDAALETRMIAQPGVSLEDHWNQGDAQRALANGRWTTIVLQQGPSSRADSQQALREYVVRFDLEARRHGTRVGVYMVWPPRSGPGTFAQVHDSYARAARDVKGILLPAGDAFREALRLQPDMALFDTDGFHPSALGSFLAAVVIHQRLSERPEPFVPLVLESRTQAFPKVAITPAERDTIRVAASHAAAAGR